jgi:hypothetical protein
MPQPRPSPSPLSPLQSLDMNRNDQRQSRRPSQPGLQWIKKGATKPSDIARGEVFPWPYNPSAPPLSISSDNHSAAAASSSIERKHTRPTAFHDPRQSAGPVSSFSPSSCSSYGSYIGSHLYGNGKAAPSPSGWQQNSRAMFERSVPDVNDSSGSSRLASFSPGGGECSGKRLTPAPAMQRELSSRSNDGFLFQPEEECETHYTITSTSPNHHNNNHNENIPMYTPHDQPRGHRQQLTIVPPRPFSLFPLDHDTCNTTSRRGSRDKTTATTAAKATTAGLMLESPWKSPGWKVREEKSGGGRNRSGSLLGMSAIDTENGEIPGVCRSLSLSLSSDVWFANTVVWCSCHKDYQASTFQNDDSPRLQKHQLQPSSAPTPGHQMSRNPNMIHAHLPPNTTQRQKQRWKWMVFLGYTFIH